MKILGPPAPTRRNSFYTREKAPKKKNTAAASQVGHTNERTKGYSCSCCIGGRWEDVSRKSGVQRREMHDMRAAN